MNFAASMLHVETAIEFLDEQKRKKKKLPLGT